jgi:hypothetical protein
MHYYYDRTIKKLANAGAHAKGSTAQAETWTSINFYHAINSPCAFKKAT